MIRRALTATVLGLALLTAAIVPGAVAQGTPRASFNDIEDEVMCVTCNVPLNVAQSPQATDQREEIRRLIAMGLEKDEIFDRLVAEFGEQVLADPPTEGFNIATWLVPAAAIGGVALTLMLTIPRWRRQGLEAPSADGSADDGPQPSPADLRRLDEDLAASEA